MRNLFVLLLVLAGCGPSEQQLREQNVSIVKTQVKAWDGTTSWMTTATDAYGRPLVISYRTTKRGIELEVRSCGPDGYPYNNDDVTHWRFVGEPSDVNKEVEKISGSITRGATRGVKEGLSK